MKTPSDDRVSMNRAEPPKPLTPEEFRLFRDWIHSQSGIFMEDSKTDSLRLSLGERLSELSIADYQDYFEKLSRDEDEFKELMNLVTINETSFFRFPAQFEAFRNFVIPEIMDAASITKRRFQVWSAGCSTGEEPYTIAMTLLDSVLPELAIEPQVIGTDVSMRALMRAQQGWYPKRSVSTLKLEQVEKWFDKHGEKYQPTKAVRDLCSFNYQNLCRHPFAAEYSHGWDVIFCRNVTIYFQQETTKKIVDLFYEALNPGGYLFIGHSETLASVSQRFEAVERDGVFLYRKPHAPKIGSLNLKTPTTRPAEKPAAKPAPAKPRMQAWKETPATPAAPAKPKAKKPAAVEEVQGDQHLAKAMAALEAGEPSKALEQAKLSLAENSKNDDAKLVMAFAHADMGDFETATKEVDEILRVSPLSAPAQYLLGVIRRERGDLEGAVAQFKRTFYVDSNFVLAHFALAAIYRQEGRSADAAREYENTIRSLAAKPHGQWTAFLGGFDASTLQNAAERGFKESSQAANAAKGSSTRRR